MRRRRAELTRTWCRETLVNVEIRVRAIYRVGSEVIHTVLLLLLLLLLRMKSVTRVLRRLSLEEVLLLLLLLVLLLLFGCLTSELVELMRTDEEKVKSASKIRTRRPTGGREREEGSRGRAESSFPRRTT